MRILPLTFIYHGDRERSFNLTTTLSIRNIDPSLKALAIPKICATHNCTNSMVQ
ncbi:MAG: DUF3124 domain-containing protein [Desulfobacula sp.]|nr:DUF3124 domain-containing protein [Desulfobacula sp.]MBT3485659.1 DUF3124 domain-containing protein [Desulfobacula sp.]MBT3804532.1 DUF3124 domain-containing protein [Desulfobacula sp.]MBT4025809.1 DUF3124 domain-containing protein [Desulfobacula sp.]MBT4199223.1 DUF3124 domain-containing protein [Desulfobacula sp.]